MCISLLSLKYLMAHLQKLPYLITVITLYRPTLENNIKKIVKIYDRRLWSYLSGLRLNKFFALIMTSKLTSTNNIKKILKVTRWEDVDCTFMA
jgi:hypothetical protein